MTIQQLYGRAGRRVRREAARLAAKELLGQSSGQQRWGFILTYWGTFLGLIGVALAVNLVGFCILLALALALLLFGLWRWVIWSRKLKTVATVVALVVFVFLFWQKFVSSAPVRIIPEYITLIPHSGTDSYPITVRNNTADDLYAVTMRFIADAESTPNMTLKFDVPVADRRFLPGELPGEQLSDIMAFYCNDSKSRQVISVGIYHLEPNGSRNMTITAHTDKEATILARVVNVNFEPRPVTKEEGTLSLKKGGTTPGYATGIAFVWNRGLACKEIVTWTPLGEVNIPYSRTQIK